VRTLAAEKQLMVSITNPGAYRGRRAGGSGIDIVERRLALAYDGKAMLTIAASGDTTVAEVTLPLAPLPPGSRT
jgi:two-component system sensor histidine kinase AlgZ